MEAEIHFGIHYVIEEGVSGLKPLLQNRFFVGAALAATFCVIENQRFGIFRAAFAATVAPSKAEVRDGSPLPEATGDVIEGNGSGLLQIRGLGIGCEARAGNYPA